jgi:hypothetical protein
MFPASQSNNDYYVPLAPAGVCFSRPSAETICVPPTETLIKGYYLLLVISPKAFLLKIKKLCWHPKPFY